MKKALGQTVRDLKREVNKKVLKVPGIEQKVLDSTSNEPWGPHGSLLADIAHATKNYHEYQMIMAVIWKRINDTGKNWRHVYKALTVLEYLVANGSERVIDEIREHAYQISTLSDFQYIDSGGRDQGSNVRKKSQSLVLLVNDKERIQEVRQKAAANRDKFRNTSSTGGMYRPDRPDDDRYEGRYGSRDEDRNGYGRERDDDRYGRYGDSYGRDGDRYGRDSEERYGRDGYRDDDYRGRSRSIDEYQYGSRSRSSDRDRAYDEDGNYSSRGSGARADENSGARADENSVEGRGLERKFSEQSLGAPPSYEEAVGDARSPVHNDRDGETSAPSAPKPSSPPVSTSPSQATTGLDTSASPVNQEFDSFEFDPRGGSVPAAPAAPAAPATSNTPETDLLGALSDALAIVPTTSEADVLANSGSTFGASSFGNQSFEDPFGDSPFKAIPSTDNVPAQSQSFPPTSFQATTNQTFEPQPPITTTNTETASNFDFGDTFPGITYSSSSDPNTDILAGILPPSGSSAPITSQSPFPEPAQQPNANVVGGFGSTPPVSSYMPPQPYNGGPFQTQSGPTPLMAPPRHNNGLYGSQFGSAGPTPSQSQFGYVGPVPSQSQFGSVGPVPSQSQFGSVGPVPSQFGSAGPVPSQFGSAGPVPSQFGSAGPVPSQMAQPQQHNNDVLGNLMGSATSSPASSVGPLAIVPVQPTKEKFETKSTVWADTLSRGLVDLNISGVKTNPLADIGIDFDAINRKEKRMEKPTTAPVVSTINMGKAMGSGSGMGRAGATAIRPPANPMMAPGMGMGTGMGMGMGMGAGYGSMSQPMGGMGMGMGMGAGYGGMSQPMGGMGMNMGGMGMGMNMGMGQGHPMQPPTGMPPGPPTMQGGYNPMMGGGGGYAPQQPYGGGYR